MFFLKCFLITILIISSNCNQIGLSKEKKTSLDPFIFIVLGADQSKSNVIDENESNQSNSGNSSGSSDEKEAEITCNIESYVFKIKSNIDIQCVVADTINVKYSITPELPLGLNFNKDFK